MLAVKAKVGSLLAKLAMEFTLVCAGHPLSVVLMHRIATNLTGTLLRVSFARYVATTPDPGPISTIVLLARNAARSANKASNSKKVSSLGS